MFVIVTVSLSKVSWLSAIADDVIPRSVSSVA